MASIGDLFFALRGDGKQLEVDVKKAGDKAGTSFGARMSASLKKSWSGQEIGKGLVQGLGLAGGLGAAALFTGAISKIGDVLSDATQAALAEEVSIQKLGTALKANIPNWNGETAAIEKVLQSRLKLGFSDDEQRESLALLIVATKDETKALDIQRVAMDLARLKGIDLKTASEALIKVEAGQFRALKALGIQLPKNATATDALRAVEKAAAGQAEDYANTNSGKLLASQVEVGEAMEKLGEIALPLVVAGTEFAAQTAEDLASNLDGVTDAIDVVGDAAASLGIKGAQGSEGTFDLVHAGQDLLAVMNPTKVKNTLGVFADTIDNIGGDARAMRFQLGLLKDEGAAGMHVFKGKAEDDLIAVSKALDGVGGASGDLADDVKADTKVITTSWEEMRDDVVDAAEDLIDKALDPVAARDRLIATNAEVAAARRVLASKTATAAERRDAEVTLHETTRDTAEALLKLSRAGQAGSAAYNTGVANLRASIKAATGPTKIYLQGVLDKILQIEKEGRVVPINIKVNRFGNIGTEPPRAAGGPVTAGQAYIVGERRPELFVPNVNGTILPSVPSMSSTGTPLGGTTIWQLTTNGLPPRAETPAEVVAQLRRAARIGAVKPPRVPPGWAP